VVSRIEERLGLRCVEPEGAFYTMVDVSKYGDSLQCAEKLLEHGVITVPGIAFGEESEGFLRLSFCADIDVLEEGLDRIKKALNG
jgi:aspartate/methionine/tyrosine aminotransferase